MIPVYMCSRPVVFGPEEAESLFMRMREPIPVYCIKESPEGLVIRAVLCYADALRFYLPEPEGMPAFQIGNLGQAHIELKEKYRAQRDTVDRLEAEVARLTGVVESLMQLRSPLGQGEPWSRVDDLVVAAKKLFEERDQLQAEVEQLKSERETFAARAKYLDQQTRILLAERALFVRRYQEARATSEKLAEAFKYARDELERITGPRPSSIPGDITGGAMG